MIEKASMIIVCDYHNNIVPNCRAPERLIYILEKKLFLFYSANRRTTAAWKALKTFSISRFDEVHARAAAGWLGREIVEKVLQSAEMHGIQNVGQPARH